MDHLSELLPKLFVVRPRNSSDTPGDDDIIADDVGICDEATTAEEVGVWDEVTIAEDVGICDEVINRSDEEILVDAGVRNDVVAGDDVKI